MKAKEEKAMAEEQNPQSILDLSTDSSARRSVRIDGQLYEIVNPDELSIAKQARLETFARLLRDLVSSGEADEADEARMEADAEMLINAVLKAPPDIKARLSSLHRLRILNAVFQRPAPEPSSPPAIQ